MTLTFGSLFAGIGGLDLGLERAGLKATWQVENDPYCDRVLKKHWPEVPRYGDIKGLTGEELEPVDLICGGFPCQDLSYAGRGSGLEGERSGLWFEMLRLVRILRPQYVLVENVPGILTRGIDVVLGGLALCGYDCEWDCVSAASVGAQHRRDRIFIVAHSRCEPREQRTEIERGIRGLVEARNPCGEPERSSEARILAHANPNRCHDEGKNEKRTKGSSCSPIVPLGEQWENPIRQLVDVSDPDKHREEWSEPQYWQRSGTIQNSEGLREFRERNTIWESEPDVGRVADGVPDRVDRLRTLGNAVVPQVAEFIGRRIIEFDGGIKVTK